ncbi:MAG TPA: DinB family protein, partial [Vicinamibacterales bacterium]|nr:DinB family protein [Vicinamibacterales bacterium]
MNELEYFLTKWDDVAHGTVELMRSLPDDAYDYRPDPGARSIGELAWHLAEADAYVSYGIERGTV